MPHEPPINMWAGYKRHRSCSAVPQPVESVAWNAGLIAELAELLSDGVLGPGMPELRKKDVRIIRANACAIGSLDGKFESLLPDLTKQFLGLGP